MGISLALLIRPGFAGESLPPLYVSHVLLVLDQPTYEALRDAPEIRALAHTEVTHTVSGDREYTGFYLWGRQTYVEFFGSPSPIASLRTGDAGFELWIEDAGGIQRIENHLRREYGDGLIVRSSPKETPAGNIPWYKFLKIKPEGPQVFGFWFGEDEPSYLPAMHPEVHFRNPLSRAESFQFSYRPDLPLRDVERLTVALEPADIARLTHQLGDVGWHVTTLKSGAAIAQGPEFRILLRPVEAGSQAGLRQIDMSLHHAARAKSLPLGTALFSAQGRTASLYFGRPPDLGQGPVHAEK